VTGGQSHPNLFCLSCLRRPITLGVSMLYMIGSNPCTIAEAVMAINGCVECLKKQRAIDRLTEENQRLRQKLRYQERPAQEGFFGASTPSAKLPVKPNTKPAARAKPKGARPGLSRGTENSLDVGKQFSLTLKVTPTLPRGLV
jgi:hypothetical protein